MQTGRAFHWQQLFIAGCLSILFVPGWAQERIPPELLLNNIPLNTTYLEVLARRGVPHYIGPSVSGVTAITSLLLPAEPKRTTVGSAMPAAPYAAAPSYTAPYGSVAGTPVAPAPQKTESTYMVWRYDGNGKTPDAEASFTTYVFLNDMGVVEAVVVNLNNPEAVLNIQTETGVTFGTKLSDIVKIYNWPQPFTRVGNLYYCSYPEQKVTFALDTTTRKVTCISIGVAFVVTAQSLEAGEAAIAGGVTPVPGQTGRPGTMYPPMPGGMDLPGMIPGGYMQPGMMMPDGMYPPGFSPYGDLDPYVPPGMMPGAGGMFPPGMRPGAGGMIPPS